jgi:hypothetical protein
MNNFVVYKLQRYIRVRGVCTGKMRACGWQGPYRWGRCVQVLQNCLGLGGYIRVSQSCLEQRVACTMEGTRITRAGVAHGKREARIAKKGHVRQKEGTYNGQKLAQPKIGQHMAGWKGAYVCVYDGRSVQGACTSPGGCKWLILLI